MSRWLFPEVMRVLQIKILYAAASLLWLIYSSVQLFSPHITNHLQITSGTLLCLLLFISIPAVGYVLLFMLFPRAGRFLRR
jgi:hypothetical protein